MITDVLGMLQFATNPNTRATLSAILNAASRRQPNWQTQIQVAGGTFTPSNWPMISAFTNDLFLKVSATGMSRTKFERFQAVYQELISNAYDHGCAKRSRWTISVKCIFCRWYVQLEVKDDGKGFLVHEALDKVAHERANGERQGRSGLELVQTLSDSVYVRGRNSHVTVVIAGEDRIRIRTSCERLGNSDLLIVIWLDEEEWSFLVPDWKPLKDVLDTASQPLILVKFARGSSADETETYPKPIEVPDDERDPAVPATKLFRKAWPIIKQCALDESHYFAYLVSTQWTWVYDDLRSMETSNLRFFFSELEARQWLELRARSVRPTGQSS